MKRTFALMLALLIVPAMVMPASAREPQVETDVYIAIMARDAAIAYRGGVSGMTATRPDPGRKIDAGSPQVREYTDFLKQEHDGTLQAAGAAESDKIYSYTYAFNGFAARLSKEEAAAVARQPGVVLVLRDQMRYAATNDTPRARVVAYKGLGALGGFEPPACGF